MAELPLISIVLPTYNGSKYLSGAIESCLAQTYSSWQLIIVDDASTDGTSAIANRYAQADGRIIYLRNETNQKLPRSLNRGFESATGEYFTWTSDDNLFQPGALEQLAAVLSSASDVDLVYADLMLIDDDGRQTGMREMPDPTSLAHCNCVGACFLYRAEVHHKLGGYDSNLFLVEDWDFWLRAGYFYQFAHLPQTLYQYRLHATSLTSTRRDEIRAQRENLLRRHLPHLRFCTGSSRAKGYLRLASFASQRKAWLPSMKNMVQALIASPLVTLRSALRFTTSAPSE